MKHTVKVDRAKEDVIQIRNKTKGIKREIEKLIEVGFNKKGTASIESELIRSLRIQNAKLLQQVVKLKNDVKRSRINKAEVLSHINNLIEIINK